MSCESIPSISDLEKVKLNADDFGRLMGTGEGTSTNGVTGQVRPTYNKVIKDLGFKPASFTFVTGGTLQPGDNDLAVHNPTPAGDGNYYSWGGPLPKVVTAGSTPATSGGLGANAWIPRTDAVLRPSVIEALRRSYAEAGYSLIGTFNGTGIVVTTATDVVLWEPTGVAYAYSGTLPHTIGASETPIGDPLWVPKPSEILRSQLAASGGAGIVGFQQAGVGAVPRTAQDKMREWVSVRDFGAIGDGVADDTAALADAAAYVNAFPLNSRPTGIFFPKGAYRTSSPVWFKRPVYAFALGDAVINYTGVGSSAMKLGDDGISGFDTFLQGEYTVDGLRFAGGASAIYGIYINDYVIEPRIRNVTFEDYGNSSSYDIYSQFEVWDILIENCRKITYSSLTAVGNFIAITGRNKANTANDGGNSRVTIRDCWMTSYSNQELGFFALINATQSRIIGGGFQHSNGGIILGPVANAALIDGVYAEISTTTAPVYITVFGSTEGGLTSAQNVKVRNGYINMHQEVIGNAGRMITTNNANARLIGWNVENMTVSNFVNGQVLIVQNDVSGQRGNTYKNIKPLFVPLSADDGRRFALRGAYANAEAWASLDVEVGVWAPSVGGTATYTARSGKYTKVGNVVTATFDITINALGTGSKSSISGLPYACGESSCVGSVGYYISLALSVLSLNIRVDSAASSITITGLTAAATGVGGTLAALGNGTRVIGSITYLTA